MRIYLVAGVLPAYWAGDSVLPERSEPESFRAFEDSFDAKIYVGELKATKRYRSVEVMEIDLKRAGG